MGRICVLSGSNTVHFSLLFFHLYFTHFLLLGICKRVCVCVCVCVCERVCVCVLGVVVCVCVCVCECVRRLFVSHRFWSPPYISVCQLVCVSVCVCVCV